MKLIERFKAYLRREEDFDARFEDKKEYRRYLKAISKEKK